MDKKILRKQIRRSFNPVSWSLVVYYIILNVSVALALLADIVRFWIEGISNGGQISEEGLMRVTNNGWGYILACAVGVTILLCWKEKTFWKEQIWAKGRPMGIGTFGALLVLVVGCQMAATITAGVLELILNQFGLSAQASLESATMSVDTLGMWMYLAILAPVTEELLFRGLVFRLMRPYGKRFAIFGSAFLFGIFHGNLIQSPYAFLVGLVLGYVACEYSIAWAMLLHMINNMVLGDIFNRVTVGMPGEIVNLIFLLLTAGCAIAGIVILVCKRGAIRLRLDSRMDKRALWCFFTNPGTIVLILMMVLNMILMIVAV